MTEADNIEGRNLETINQGKASGEIEKKKCQMIRHLGNSLIKTQAQQRFAVLMPIGLLEMNIPVMSKNKARRI